ncbi:MAG: M10 family metallopeptidase C-terminal domain-containing protein, partial [Phenylobacterium sp.]
GSDVLSGGGGADVLSGGGGADSFVFKALTDSLPGHADDITDLTNGDIIDLSAIDADTTTPGIQAFTLTTGFSDVPGQAVLSYDGVSNKTTLSLDVNGDGASDMNVLIDGDHHLFTHFVL